MGWSRSIGGGRRIRRHHPQNFLGDPGGWLRYWFRYLIAVELYALASTAITWSLILATNPWLRAPDAVYSRAGAALGLALCSVVVIVFDAAVFVRARRMARARR